MEDSRDTSADGDQKHAASAEEWAAGKQEQVAGTGQAVKRSEELEEQVRQLTYERRLLGSARMTLDLLNAGGIERWDCLRKEAGELAQQIVDEIGHPVTDEPALGPSLRAEVAELRRQLATKEPAGGLGLAGMTLTSCDAGTEVTLGCRWCKNHEVALLGGDPIPRVDAPRVDTELELFGIWRQHLATCHSDDDRGMARAAQLQAEEVRISVSIEYSDPDRGNSIITNTTSIHGLAWSEVVRVAARMISSDAVEAYLDRTSVR